MRVKIEYTTEVPDDYRRAINDHYGRPGLATRQQVKGWYEAHGVEGDGFLGDIMRTWDENED